MIQLLGIANPVSTINAYNVSKPVRILVTTVKGREEAERTAHAQLTVTMTLLFWPTLRLGIANLV